MRNIATILSIAFIASTVIAQQNASSLAAVDLATAKTLISGRVQDPHIKSEIESGLRNIESFVTTDGVRRIIYTSFVDQKTKKTVKPAQGAKFIGTSCFKAYDLDPIKAEITAEYEENCIGRDDSTEF